MSKSLAVMQPTYLPWSGYFALMDSVDEFVILDHVQFARRSWQQRNKILQNNTEAWLTVPVKKSPVATAINDIELVDIDACRDRHLASIHAAYSHLPFYAQYADGLGACYESQRLVDVNMALINHIRTCIGITTPIVMSSELSCTGVKAALMLDIATQRNATRYISVKGSQDYLEASNAFTNNPIELHYFDYATEPYPQPTDMFNGFISIIEMMFTLGDETRQALRAGRKHGKL